MIFGRLILRDSGGHIMKKSSLYSIYALLFVIISNVADSRITAGVAIICAVLNIILSLVSYYIEDKYN